MNGVKIIKHSPKHSDGRGETFSYTADRNLASAKNGFKEILVVRRKKGAVSGQHYHKGTDPSRNPEIHYVISGKLKLIVKDLSTGRSESHIIRLNTELRIGPNIYHKMEFLEDTVFLELHSEVSPYKDVYRIEVGD